MMTERDPIDVAEASEEVEEHQGRGAAAWLLICFGTIVMVLSTLNVWVERQLLDTDAWVDTSGRLLEDDDLRQELSARLVDRLYEATSVGDAIDENLPEQLQGLGGPLAGLLRDPLVDTVDALLRSDAVQEVWKQANRTAHATVVAILEDDVGDLVGTAGGAVVIDLGGLLRQAAEQIGLGDAALDAIPDDAGVFEIVQSDALESAQNVIRLVKILSIVTFLVVVISFGAAIYLARDWWRIATRNVGLAIALGGFVVLVAVRLGIDVVSASPDTAGSRAATESILVIGTSLLQRMAWSEIAIGVLIAVGASLLGPARYATWVRQQTARGFQRSALATWIGLAVLVLAVLAWSPLSVWGNWLSVLFVAAILVVGLEAIRRTSLAEAATLLEEAADGDADQPLVEPIAVGPSDGDDDTT